MPTRLMPRRPSLVRARKRGGSPARGVAAAAGAAVLLAAGLTWAQTQPAPPPAAGQPAPPPAAGQPAPPPGYGPPGQPAPPPGYAPPPGQPARPPGYGPPGQPAPPPGYGPPGQPAPYPYPPPGYGAPGQPSPYYPYPPPPGYYPPYGYGPPPSEPSKPRMMDYQEGASIPQGYHLETRARRGMVIAGATMFGTMYMVSVLAAMIGDASNNDDLVGLYIPVVGPFIALGNADRPEGTDTFLFLIAGLTQTTGAALLIGGYAAPKKVLVRDDLARRVQVGPMLMSRGSVGLGVRGVL